MRGINGGKPPIKSSLVEIPMGGRHPHEGMSLAEIFSADLSIRNIAIDEKSLADGRIIHSVVVTRDSGIYVTPLSKDGDPKDPGSLVLYQSRKRLLDEAGNALPGQDANPTGAVYLSFGKPGITLGKTTIVTEG